jgi:hypothetical protein
MAAPRIVLTPALQVQIVASIRAGGFGHVAAQAWGVPKAVYESWLARGQGRRAREPYRSFAREVAAAQAQARLRAETRTFEQDCKFWLEHGPGRALRDDPGWGSPSRPSPDDGGHEESPLASPAVRALMRRVLQICGDHPEMRDRLSPIDGWADEKNGKPPSAARRKSAGLATEPPPSAPSAAVPPPSSPASAPAAHPTYPSANGTPPPRAA